MLQKIILLTLALAFPAAAIAEEKSSEHYRSIPNRNLFGLKNAPEPERVQQQAPEQPKVKLTGITTVSGNKQAVLKVEAPGAKPLPLGQRTAQAQETESMILGEGQREGNVEVLEINEDAGTVRLVNSGKPATITFEKEPVQLAAPQVAQPGAFGAPGSVPAIAGTAVTSPGTGSTASVTPLPSGLANRVFPNRTNTGTAVADASNAPGLPPGGILLQQNVGGQTNLAPLPGNEQLTAEEQAVLLQLQEQLNSGNQPNLPAPNPTGVPDQYQYQYRQPANPPVPVPPQSYPSSPLLPQ